MASGTRVGTFFGIPVRVHVTLWIVLPLFAVHFAAGEGLISLLWGLLAAVGLFASIVLHELGHSLVAMRSGCRVTDILLLPIGGMARLRSVPERPADEILMAATGPLVSLCLAILFFVLSQPAALLGWHHMVFMLVLLSAINLMLTVFNLLPSFPMDGGRILRAALTPRMGRLAATRNAARVGKWIAAAMFLAALLWIPFPGNLSLMAIAFFIYYAGRSEYRNLLLRERWRRAQETYFGPLFGPTRPSAPGDIYVSPPPYGEAPDDGH